METWQKQLQERLDTTRSDCRVAQVRAVRKRFLQLISDADEEQRPQVMYQLAQFANLEPSVVEPVVSGELEDEIMVLQRAPRKQFGFETYVKCLEDGCEAAGGEWKDDGPLGPNCYYREGTSFLERRATDFAYA